MVREVFTSVLEIESDDKSLTEELMKSSHIAEKIIDTDFNYFKSDSLVRLKGENFNFIKYINSNLYCNKIDDIVRKYNTLVGNSVVDVTCCLKGLFIKYVMDYCHNKALEDESCNFSINFGGDMYGRGNAVVDIENSSVSLCTPMNMRWAIFTSGNFGRRGPHITMYDREPAFKSLTLYSFKDVRPGLLAYMDALTTFMYSMNEINPDAVDFINSIAITTDDKVLVGGGGSHV